MKNVVIGKKYRHFKGNVYEVIDIVHDSENKDKLIVIYESIKEKGLKWARPYEMFISEVDKNKYPLVKQKYRFEEVDE